MLLLGGRRGYRGPSLLWILVIHRGFVRRVGSIPSCRGPSIWILAESSIAGDVGPADIDIPRRSKLIPFEHRALSFYTSRVSCFLAS